MIKLWKIGTSIDSYIREIEDYVNELGCSSYHLKTKDNEVIFKFNNGKEEIKNQSTASQFQRVLLSLGYITSNVTSFRQDKSVLDENITFEIKLRNEKESHGDFIIANLQDRLVEIFKHNDYLYPAEPSLIFSLLATMFTLKDKKYENIINSHIEIGKIANVKKYFNNIAIEILNSQLISPFLDIAREYIVGISNNVDEFIKGINSEISKKTKPIQSLANLQEQIVTEPLTFGMFIKKYFSSANEILIPIYQRKYVWDSSIVETLLNDILNVKLTHYIGNIIVKSHVKNNNQVFKIIDGQQRITTMTLILRAIFDYSKFRKAQVDLLTNSKFNVMSDDSIANTFKRIDGNQDFEAFKKVVRGEIHKNENGSKIISNYISILSWIARRLTSLEDIESFWENLLNRINLVLINDKMSNEYKLFEKLNTGAIPLTILELFKNYTLDQLHNTTKIKESLAQSLFEKHIEQKFSKKSKDKDIKNFITTYLRCQNSQITNETLFNQFKDTIETIYFTNDPTNTFERIILDIGKEIDLYKAISTYDIYTKKDSFTYNFADFLYILDNRSVYYPVIIKLFKFHSKNYLKMTHGEINKIREYLRVLEIFEVRLQVVTYRGQSLSSKIEMILEKLDENTSPTDFWLLLKGEDASSTSIASIDRFKETLANQPIANKPAKLIITRLENYFLLGGWELAKNDNNFLGLYQNPSQREHLLPLAWEEHWKNDLMNWTKLEAERIDMHVKKYINFIGNAFPIPEWSNQEIRNQSLAKKIASFKKQPYSKHLIIFNGYYNRLDKVSNTFSHNDIRKRSKQIAEIACEIWADYI